MSAFCHWEINGQSTEFLRPTCLINYGSFWISFQECFHGKEGRKKLRQSDSLSHSNRMTVEMWNTHNKNVRNGSCILVHQDRCDGFNAHFYGFGMRTVWMVRVWMYTFSRWIKLIIRREEKKTHTSYKLWLLLTMIREFKHIFFVRL